MKVKNMKEKDMNRPNIVFILADDMGYGDIGCNNPHSKIPTPNLDALAKQGMRFTDAHAPSSVCTPTRYTILTGRYAWRGSLKKSVLLAYDPPLIEDGRLTIADILKGQGYRTACFGKWHLGLRWLSKNGEQVIMPPEKIGVSFPGRSEIEKSIDFTKPVGGGPIDHGFEYYFGDDVPNLPPYTYIENNLLLRQPTVIMPSSGDGWPKGGWPGLMSPGWVFEEEMPEFTERAVSYILESGSDPFFLYFPLTAPHVPIVPADEFKGRSGAGAYGDFVVETDWSVGRIMQALEKKGIADNTLLIFTSDNGPAASCFPRIQEHGHYSMGHLRGIKANTWEGGHRVPFIARWPDCIPGGTENGNLIMLGDLMASAADILSIGLPEQAGEDSVSFLPLLKPESMHHPVRDCMVHHSMQGDFALRKDNWVYIDAPTGEDVVTDPNCCNIVDPEPGWFKRERGYEAHAYPGELYNLNEDIRQRRNLYGEYPDKVREMKEQLEMIKGENADAGTYPWGACVSE